MSSSKLSRRDFFKSGAISGTTLMLGTSFLPTATPDTPKPDYASARIPDSVQLSLPSKYALDLSPAKWIWYPSQRTLANTFILFRKSITIKKEIKSATGWILGDSRYKLTVNKQRIQWGPPPSDPRFSEADPVDLTMVLKNGENIIGATVLFYGHGDGTWPIGKAGFIFKLDITYSDGSTEQIVSDKSWQCHLARSWKPGQYKRWYLRALQEEFDARKYPFGWSSPWFKTDLSWLTAMELIGSPAMPALSTNMSDYAYDSSSGSTVTELRKRSVPLLQETDIDDVRLEEALYVHWNQPVDDYFDMIVPDAYEVAGNIDGIGSTKPWTFSLSESNQGAVLTVTLKEQVVGWPYFTVEAAEGTVIEVLVQEGHNLAKNGGPAIMNNHHHSWSRFICRAGENNFQPFDFESFRWLQLHFHGALGSITVKNIGVKRRMYPWPNPASVSISDKNFQVLLNASINTLYNNSQETIVDGMGRERQQYSGDLGHVVHALHRVFGNCQLPARFVNTYSQGITLDGYFLDTWPAFDRLNRLSQRQLGLTKWGPILDHGIGFNFDCYYHYMYSGTLDDLEEVWPRLEKFCQYLKSIVQEDGLLPVENIGIPSVWIDHIAYAKQRHKQCAFNLYAAAMLKNAFNPLAIAMNKPEEAKQAMEFGDFLHKNTINTFWDSGQKLFINNKPWLSEEKGETMCDRSLATAVLFDLCPGNQNQAVIETLVARPANLGMSYPPNTNWYLWALGKAGKTDAIFHDFNTRWKQLRSAYENNTMQEDWQVVPDTGSQWSHASIAPLLTAYMDLAGIKPITPGYTKFSVEPLPGSLELLEIQNYTPSGPIGFKCSGKKGKRILSIKVPLGISGELVLDSREKVKLKELTSVQNLKHYELAPGSTIELKLKYL